MPWRKRSFRNKFRRARTFVRKTVRQMGPIEVKRIILDDLSIPDISSVAYDNPLGITLIQANESVDEEVESNGSTIATARPYSKIVSMKLRLLIRGTVNDPLTIRWMLLKRPDGEVLITSLADSSFHTSDDTATQREVRANTLAKGMFLTNSSSGISHLNVFIRRKTLLRLGSLRENDTWVLLLAANAAATTQPKVSGMGAIYVRMN